MAIQKRYSGDSAGVVNVDRSRHDAPAAQIISTGIGKHITCIRVQTSDSQDLVAQMGVGGAVEAILRTLQVKGTTIAYQVDGPKLSIIVEATGWGVTNPQTGAVITTADDDFQAALIAIGNRALDAAIPVTAFDFTKCQVNSAGGLNLGY
jgi:hypothetical protein